MSVAKKAKEYIGRSFQEARRESFRVTGCNGKSICILCTETVGRSVI